jgi:hypothetical protein
MPQAPDEQACTNEQQHRECALHHQQDRTKPRSLITTIPSATLQGVAHLATRRVKRRHQSRQQRRHRDHPRREEEAPHIGEHRGTDIVGEEPAAENSGAPLRQHQPQRTTENGEHQAFRHQLPDQPCAPHADREPERDLTPPAHRAREEEVRHVGAGDDEHDRRDTAHPRRDLRLRARLRPPAELDRPQLTAHPGTFRRAPPRVGRRGLSPARRPDAGEVCFRDLAGDTGRATRQQLQPAPVVVAEVSVAPELPGVAGDRDVHRRDALVAHAHKCPRRHADDGAHGAIHPERLADDVATPEFRHPVRVSEHGHRLARRMLSSRAP